MYKSPPIDPMQSIPLDNGDLPVPPICRNGKKSQDWLLPGNPSSSEEEYKDGRERRGDAIFNDIKIKYSEKRQSWQTRFS